MEGTTPPESTAQSRTSSITSLFLDANGSRSGSYGEAPAATGGEDDWVHLQTDADAPTVGSTFNTSDTVLPIPIKRCPGNGSSASGAESMQDWTLVDRVEPPKSAPPPTASTLEASWDPVAEFDLSEKPLARARRVDRSYAEVLCAGPFRSRQQHKGSVYQQTHLQTGLRRSAVSAARVSMRPSREDLPRWADVAFQYS